MAYSGPLRTCDAAQAEMKSLLMGLRLLISREELHVPLIVEGDSAIVIGWMKNYNQGPWWLSHLIKEAAFLSASLNILFMWIPREVNLMVDGLAKRGVGKASLFKGSILEEMEHSV